MKLSEIRQAEGYEAISRVLPTLGQISPEEWHLKTKIWSIRYRIPIEELLPLYKPPIGKHPPPAKPITVKVSEAKPIKVAAEPNQEAECKVCGKTFIKKRPHGLYCSRTCGSRLRNINKRLKLKNSK